MKKTLLTLLITAGSLFAFAQWSDNPLENNRITPLKAGIYDNEIKMAKNGTSFIAFSRPLEGNIATFLQIVDKNGIMLFPEEGKLISHKNTISFTMVSDLLFVDRDGNAIIAVPDCRNSIGLDLGYSLYKVSPTGEMLWGEDGIDLARGNSFYLVHNMKISQIEDGSYVCAWGITEWDERSYIQMQRISQTGELLWKDEEARLYSSSFDYEYPYLVSAGNNQVILIFSRGGGRHLTARKIDFDASSVWAEDLVIYRGGYTIPPLWVIIKVISDQMGGAFVGWYDDRNNDLKESTYVAHITTDGKFGFASGEGGERVGYNDYLRGFAPAMYFNKLENALYVAWRETSSGQSWQQMTAQKIKIPTGELMWNSNGLEVSPLTENHSIGFYAIQGNGRDNVAIAFTSCTWDPQYFYGWDINNIMLLNSKGEYVWDDKIIKFSTAVGYKGDLNLTPVVDENFWVAAWGDERKIEGDPNGSRKIYLQRINVDGTLGDNGINIKLFNPLETSFAVFPTVINGYAEFHINAEKSCNAELIIYSMMGQKMETVFLGSLHNGDNVISWNSPKNSLSKGIYLATLNLGNGIKSLKIIIN
ncbi:MAG: T9SS type A sorting domain-containing protein [Bacteroidales bacterium]|jgi:hypothetical protein|nr:T9SS type A sorting domain-containing protein [Bacteroidales bacterium]